MLILVFHRIDTHDMPYLCLKYAGGSVDSTSTNGRSTTTNSPLVKKSTHNIGRYCVIILKSLQGLSSSTTSRLRFRPPRRTVVSKLTLNIQVAPQKMIYLVFPASVSEPAGSKDTPITGSWALVKRLGRLLLSSFPQTGNCRASTS